MKKPYTKAMMGGTFDRLHEAHRELLRTAAHMAENVFVGIVGEQLGEKLFPKKTLGEMIEPYETRAGAVRTYMEQFTTNTVVGELIDPWGPAPKDLQADAIVVSNETIPNAERINQMRQDRGLSPLDIIVIPWVFYKGELLSSTLMRKIEAGLHK